MMNTVPFEHEPGRIGVITGKTRNMVLSELARSPHRTIAQRKYTSARGVGRTDN